MQTAVHPILPAIPMDASSSYAEATSFGMEPEPEQEPEQKSRWWLWLVLLAATLWFSGRLAVSRFGYVLRGAKSNDLRMMALGFPVFRYRLAAFVISGAFGGLSGILLANEGAYVSPAMMSWVKSGDLIVIVVLGGIGTLLGPLWGAIAFFALEELLQPVLNLAHTGWGEYWQMVFGPLLVLVALYAGGGIDSLLGRHPGARPGDHPGDRR